MLMFLSWFVHDMNIDIHEQSKWLLAEPLTKFGNLCFARV